MTPDLFTYVSYPVSPGYQDRDTSKAAASDMKPTAATLRAQCLAVLRSNHVLSLTADEVALWLGLSVLSIRPRISELAMTGKIKDTGNRRKNDSGRSAIVWTCTEKLQSGETS